MKLEIDNFWKPRLAGATSPSASNAQGWNVGLGTDTFVEPTLRIVEGSPEQAQILIVAAPGAVGKSSYARRLSVEADFALVDLVKTEPLGGNFFTGGVANAFGHAALSQIASGKLGLVVDALDEAQLRSGPNGFAAGLLDLAKLVSAPGALPTILFGRAAAAEEAWLLLDNAGLSSCLLQIDFFDDERAVSYLDLKLPIVAARRQDTAAAFARHPDQFRALALDTREQLKTLPGGEERRFTGYAPVLDAICSFALSEPNPAARGDSVKGESPVGLINSIATTILEREQKKVTDQIAKARMEGSDLSNLYEPTEQLGRVAATLLGAPHPAGPIIADPNLRLAYDESIKTFAPQHPFLDGADGPANAAFAAFVLFWALTSSEYSTAARQALHNRPDLNSGILFELYTRWLDSHVDDEPQRTLPLSDVGILYAALNAQTGAGERAVLEIDADSGDPLVELSFEVEDSSDKLSDTIGDRSYGPFLSDLDSILELGASIANVFIDAPLFLVLGDGNSLTINAPVDINVANLTIEAGAVAVFPPAPPMEGDWVHQVFLLAEDSDVGRVRSIAVHEALLSVSMPGTSAYPWTDYARTFDDPVTSELAELRRRTRKIFTAFRSHSKGALVRLAAKIDHARMMKKDDLGPKIVNKFLADGILELFDAGKFYVLRQDRMAELLQMSYQALQQQEWSQTADEYLSGI